MRGWLALFDTVAVFTFGGKTGKLDMRTNALARNVIVDENGLAKGVAYIDRDTKQEIHVLQKQ